MPMLQLLACIFILASPVHSARTESENEISLSQLYYKEDFEQLQMLGGSEQLTLKNHMRSANDQNKGSSTNDFVENVHIVFMNHLDVGYASFINNVLNEYFKTYYPRAIAVAEDLQKSGYVETFVYTTHPWLVSLYLNCPPDLWLAGIQLQCPTAEEKSAFIRAIKKGYITWHAGPFNLQVENAHEPWLFESGLDLSSQLDHLFNITRPVRVLSQRDVPGLTQAAIPILAKKGITGVSVGVNNMTPPPAVANLFVWQYGTDSVIYTVHPGGYPDDPGSDPAHPGGLSRPDCVVVSGFPHALCFAFRTDNSGPPENVAEVLRYYEILRAEFPNADLRASTFDSFFDAVQSIRHSLPVVTNEISDTWIQGIASDPRKCAEYRAVARVMRDCFVAGQCKMDDIRVWNSSLFLIKLPEHTWGLPSEGDSIHWSNEEFHKLRDTAKNFIQSTMSWQEQRQFTYLAIDALQDHPVRAAIRAELDRLTPTTPDLAEFVKVRDMSQVFICPSSDVKQLQFGTDGSLVKLISNNPNWTCDMNCQLGQFLYISYDETDFDEFGKVYNYNGYSAGYYKRNLTANAHPESKTWTSIMTSLYRSSDGSCDFYANIQMVDKRTVDWYGAPQNIWIRYKARRAGALPTGVDIDFQLFNKTSTRLPEALLFAFRPSISRSWQMSKMNCTVDPLNVRLNGSQYQHVLDDRGVAFDASDLPAGHRSNPALFSRLRSPDVPLACPIVDSNIPHVFPAPLQPITGHITGFAFNIYNNIWDTNYIMWYPYYNSDVNFRARFYVDI